MWAPLGRGVAGGASSPGGRLRVGEDERAARLREVLHVLYLVFNEGHTASEGPDLRRDDLATEAIRLTRMLRADLPTDGEVAGLLALMILTDARRLARTAPHGSLVPLLEQDRGAWDAAKIAEGTTLVTAALATAPVGPFQVQAAIAALHAEARDAGATDWPQIVALYGVLDRIAPGPVVLVLKTPVVSAVSERAISGARPAALQTSRWPNQNRESRPGRVDQSLSLETGCRRALRRPRIPARPARLRSRDGATAGTQPDATDWPGVTPFPAPTTVCQRVRWKAKIVCVLQHTLSVKGRLPLSSPPRRRSRR